MIFNSQTEEPISLWNVSNTKWNLTFQSETLHSKCNFTVQSDFPFQSEVAFETCLPSIHFALLFWIYSFNNEYPLIFNSQTHMESSGKVI